MKIIGIDLGTTNSAVAVYEMGSARTISLKGEITTPSVIWVNPEGDYVVGKEAKQHVAVDPTHVLISTKRDMGSSATYQINGETYTPTDAATFILAYLKREASKTLGEEVNDAIITVPAYFGLQEIGEVRKAAIDAGLNPIQIIPEPTAAAIRYGIGSENSQRICVVDLGGGTFDVTVISVEYDKKLHKHTITPVNWDGDHYLGGDDFDNAIIEWMIRNGAKGFKNKLELKYIAEAAKIELASLSETSVSHPKYLPNEIVLTRSKFKSLIEEKLIQIGETIKKTIKDSKIEGEHLDMDDINRYVLVGGSCKHPVVRDYINGIIPKEAYNAPNLDTFVAEGAAILHHSMKAPGGGTYEVPVLMPKTLGVNVLIRESDEVINAVLLRKGTKLPTRVVSLCSVEEGQAVCNVQIIEGEARLANDSDNKALKTLTMDLKYESDPNRPFIVEYIVDKSGFLTFNCYEVHICEETIDDIIHLSNISEGDADVLPPCEWDTFVEKHQGQYYKEYLEISDVFNDDIQ